MGSVAPVLGGRSNPLDDWSTVTSNAIPDPDERRGLDARPSGAAFSSSWRNAVLVCTGELDPGTNPDLRRELDRVGSGATDRVTVDIGAVSFLDCGAINEFVTSRDTCRASGGDLVLRSPTSMARRMLRILDLDDLIADDAPDQAPTNGAAARTVGLGDQLRERNRASIVVEQARGIIAGHFDVSVDDAAEMLSVFARRQRRPVVAVAAAVVDRTANLADLGGHDDGGDHERGVTTVCGPIADSTGGTA